MPFSEDQIADFKYEIEGFLLNAMAHWKLVVIAFVVIFAGDKLIPLVGFLWNRGAATLAAILPILKKWLPSIPSIPGTTPAPIPSVPSVTTPSTDAWLATLQSLTVLAVKEGSPELLAKVTSMFADIPKQKES